MTAHELAIALLALPDEEVMVHDGSGDYFQISTPPYMEDEPDIVWMGIKAG